MVISGKRPVSKRTCQRSEPASVSRQRTMTIRGREFVVDGQKIRAGAPFDLASGPLDSDNRRRNHLGIKCAQGAIDLDVAVVAVGREADQLVRPQQASKSALVGAARRQVHRLRR